jgi:hypothetical protein
LCPSEFSALAARRWSLPAGVVLSWNSLPVQSFLPVEVSRLWVTRSRFVVGPCLGCTVFLRRGPLIVVQGNQFHPLFEFCVPPEFFSANPSRPAATVRLLSWALVPFSTCRHRRSTVCEFAALTGFRLQGLATLLTVCSLRSLVDPVSDRQRSRDSPFGVFLPSVRPGVPARTVPPAVSSAVGPGSAARLARQTAAPGLFPAEVPCSDRGFSAFAWGDSPGFCPFQGFASRALPGFRPISSHALVSAASEVTQPSGAPESRSARGLSIRCPSVGRRQEARNESDGDADRQPS